MSRIVKVTVEIIDGEESSVLNISKPMNNSKEKAYVIDDVLNKATSFINKHNQDTQDTEIKINLRRRRPTTMGEFNFDFLESKMFRRHLEFPFSVVDPAIEANRYKSRINLLRLSASGVSDAKPIDIKDININLDLDLSLTSIGTMHQANLIQFNLSEQSALFSYLLNCDIDKLSNLEERKMSAIDIIDKIKQEGIYASKEDIILLIEKVLPFKIAEIKKAIDEARVASKRDFDGDLVNTHNYALMNPELQNKEDNTIVEKLIKSPIAPIDFSIFDSDSELPAFILNHANFKSVHSLVLISDKNILNDINQDTAFFLITDLKENINKYFNLCEKENFGTYFNIPKKNSVVNDINEYLSNRKNVYISEYAILRIMEHYDISYSELRNKILDYDETPINIEEMKSIIKHTPLTENEIDSLLEAATEWSKKNDIDKIKTSAGKVSISLSDKVVYIHLAGSIDNNKFVESVYNLSDLLKIISPEDLMLVDGLKDKSFSYPILIANYMAKGLAITCIDKSLLFSKILVVGEATNEAVEISKDERIYFLEKPTNTGNLVLTSETFLCNLLIEHALEAFVYVDGWYEENSSKKAITLKSLFENIKSVTIGASLTAKEIKLKEDE